METGKWKTIHDLMFQFQKHDIVISPPTVGSMHAFHTHMPSCPVQPFEILSFLSLVLRLTFFLIPLISRLEALTVAYEDTDATDTLELGRFVLIVLLAP